MGRKAKPAIQPEAQSGLPNAPSWLDEIAKEEWVRLGPILLEAGLMTHLDLGAFAMYCVNWSRFVRNELICIEKGDTYIGPNSPYPIYSTEVNLSNNAQKNMVPLLKQFGLSPQARFQLKMEKKSPTDNLIKYLASKGKESVEK